MMTVADVLDQMLNAMPYSAATAYDGMVLKLSDGSAAYITVNSIREPCPFTHSHTRDWCGHPFCRTS